MNSERESNLRMGTGPRGKSKKPILLGAVGAVLAIAVIATILTLFTSSEEEIVSKGCKNDSECGDGRICAEGGCIILHSSQHAGLWHDDLSAQADAGVAWNPHPTYGEKLMASDICPAKSREVDTPDEGQTEQLAEATVHEVGSGEVLTHKFVRFKGNVWIGSLRFWCPGLSTINPEKVCASDKVAEISVGKKTRAGKPMSYVDATLSQTVPVGSISSAAIAIHSDLPRENDLGLRDLAFPLPAVLADDMRRHTVATFPLGTDVIAISGPPPTQQRLLQGHVAYYWEHKDRPSNVSIRFRAKEGASAPLDVTEVKP